MEINFALNITDEITRFKSIFDKVENEINLIVKNRNYGSDLLEIFVGWICVAPEYGEFFKPRKSKYYDHKEMFVDGKKFTLSKALEFEIELDYQTILKSNNNEIENIILQKLLYSLDMNINANKKVQEFDLITLINDLKK